jgi:cytochrome c5
MFADLATDAAKYWDESTLRTTLNGFAALPASGTNIDVSGTGLGNGNVDYGAYTAFCEHHVTQVVNTVHHAVKVEPEDTVIVDPDTGEETVIPADPNVKWVSVDSTVRVVDKFWIPSISQLGYNYIRVGSTLPGVNGFPSEGTCLGVFDSGTVNWHRETGYAAKKSYTASGTSASAVSWWARTAFGDRYGGIVFNANDSYQPLMVDKFGGTNDAAKAYPVSIFFTIA